MAQRRQRQVRGVTARGAPAASRIGQTGAPRRSPRPRRRTARRGHPSRRSPRRPSGDRSPPREPVRATCSRPCRAPRLERSDWCGSHLHAPRTIWRPRSAALRGASTPPCTSRSRSGGILQPLGRCSRSCTRRRRRGKQGSPGVGLSCAQGQTGCRSVFRRGIQLGWSNAPRIQRRRQDRFRDRPGVRAHCGRGRESWWLARQRIE